MTIEAALAALGPAPRALPPEMQEHLLQQFGPLCWKLSLAIEGRYPCAEDRDDFVSIAQMALLSAAERFEAARGLKFITYATCRMKGFLKQTAARSVGVVHVPPNMVWAKEDHRYARDRARAIEIESLPGSFADRVYDALPVPEPEDTDATESELHEAMRRLPARQRDVLIRRYQLDGQPHETRQEIGDAIGITRDRVRQIEVQAIMTLRRLLSGQWRQGSLVTDRRPKRTQAQR